MNYFEYIINFLTNLSKYDRDRNKSTFSTNSSIPNPKTDNPWRKAPRNDSVLTLNFSPNILINDADINPERWTMPNTNPDWKMFQSTPKRSESNDWYAVYPLFSPVYVLTFGTCFVSQSDSLTTYYQFRFWQGSLLLNYRPKVSPHKMMTDITWDKFAPRLKASSA